MNSSGKKKRGFLVRDESVSHSIPSAPASTRALGQISQAGTKWPTQCSFSPANSSWILITRKWIFFIYSVVVLTSLSLFVLLSQKTFSGFSACETRLTANFVYAFWFFSKKLSIWRMQLVTLTSKSLERNHYLHMWGFKLVKPQQILGLACLLVSCDRLIASLF